MARCLATQETLDMIAGCAMEIICSDDHSDCLWRGDQARRVTVKFHSRWPRAGLGANCGVLTRTRASSPPAITRMHPIPPAPLLMVVPCDVFITGSHVRSASVSSRQCGRRDQETARVRGAVSGAAHLVGAYSLGKAQRLIALLRLAGYGRADLFARARWKKSRTTMRAAAWRSASCAP